MYIIATLTGALVLMILVLTSMWRNMSTSLHQKNMCRELVFSIARHLSDGLEEEALMLELLPHTQLTDATAFPPIMAVLAPRKIFFDDYIVLKLNRGINRSYLTVRTPDDPLPIESSPRLVHQITNAIYYYE